MMPRSTVLGVVLALPAALAATALMALGLYTSIRPDVPLPDSPARTTLTEAIASGDPVEQAYALIRSGQDPNEPMAVNAPQYTGGEPVRVSPLMLAIAARDTNNAQMLLNFGARIELPQNSKAGCLARAMADPDLETIIANAWARVGTAPTCQEPHPGARTPLLAWIE